MTIDMIRMKSWVAWPGAPLAMASAALFGASTPLAKAVLGAGVNPWLLAGLLYFGSGLGLAVVRIALTIAGRPSREAPLKGADWGWMALVALSGGVVAPLLLMLGLRSTPASAAALLLNVEGLATMAIAWAVFRENVDRRLMLGAFAILAGAVLLSWQGQGQGQAGNLGLGALAIVGACVGWGVDNNLTRKISGSDPLQIAMVKGLAAGATNLALALAWGAHAPGVSIALLSGLVGLLGYGVSLILFVMALRHLGAARTGAYFSTAPFLGAILAVAMFDEAVTTRLSIAGGLMAVGVLLHLMERHDHEHVHEPMDHAHAHVHDEHHQHDHLPGDPVGEPHVHAHHHPAMTHSHPHYPDIHHRHEHAD